MKRIIFLLTGLMVVIGLASCNESTASSEATADVEKSAHEVRGFESKVAWGDHLINTIGCDDCHTPKKLTAQGPVIDESKKLMGHPAEIPPPNVDRAMFEKNGYVVSDGNLTAWVGPWGISYSANLTPHETGIGNWTEVQFKNSLRHGWYKGQEGGRMILPPMPWFNFARLTDDEIGAMFAYLKSLKPIDNQVPGPQPPVSAPPKAG